MTFFKKSLSSIEKKISPNVIKKLNKILKLKYKVQSIFKSKVFFKNIFKFKWKL